MTLNVAGGTKPMALGAFTAFRDRGLPVLYVDTDSDRLLTLGPEQGEEPLPDVLPMAEYLQAYGYRVQRTRPLGIPAAWRNLARELVAGVEAFAGALGTLNWLAATAAGTGGLQAALNRGDPRPRVAPGKAAGPVRGGWPAQVPGRLDRIRQPGGPGVRQRRVAGIPRL